MNFPNLQHFRAVMTLSLAPVLLAACSSADDEAAEAGNVAVPEPVLTPSPVATAAPDGSALTEGSWKINESASGASATFGAANSNPLMLITCDSASKSLTLALQTAVQGSQTYVLEAGGTAARLDTVADGNFALPHQRAQIARDAPIFGGFVMPGQTIIITAPDGATLQLPAAPGIRRVFEACA